MGKRRFLLSDITLEIFDYGSDTFGLCLSSPMGHSASEEENGLTIESLNHPCLLTYANSAREYTEINLRLTELQMSVCVHVPPTTLTSQVGIDDVQWQKRLWICQQEAGTYGYKDFREL